MKYAVIKTGGKQYRVAEGDQLAVEKIEVKKGKPVEFKEVLLVASDKSAKIGRPLVRGARVKAELLDQVKGKKIRVATYKAKSRYRRVKGHRQSLSRIKITQIV